MTGTLRSPSLSRIKQPDAMKNIHSSPHQPSAEIPALDALEQAMDCHENIFTIAVLLEDSAAQAADEHEKAILSGAGRIIAQETRKLQSLLETLDRQLQKVKKQPPRKSGK